MADHSHNFVETFDDFLGMAWKDNLMRILFRFTYKNFQMTI